MGTDPLEYVVLGLPPGQEARIHDFMGDLHWRIYRVRPGIHGRWEGNYPSAEAALADLQEQVDTGR
jgi:hypothetical protein